MENKVEELQHLSKLECGRASIIEENVGNEHKSILFKIKFNLWQEGINLKIRQVGKHFSCFQFCYFPRCGPWELQVAKIWSNTSNYLRKTNYPGVFKDLLHVLNYSQAPSRTFKISACMHLRKLQQINSKEYSKRKALPCITDDDAEKFSICWNKRAAACSRIHATSCLKLNWKLVPVKPLLSEILRVNKWKIEN